MPAEVTISNTEACSTCELVFRIVWQMGMFERQNKHFAIPVYCGMMTDTGGFTFNSTRPEIYFIIGELLTKHIDKDKIYRNVYHNYTESRIRLMGYVMYEKLVYIPERHAAYYTINREEQRRFNFIKGDAEGLVNIPQQIRGLKLSISLREDTEKNNIVWVSLRSVDDFPCNLMAQQFFNGGGHLNASGGRIGRHHRRGCQSGEAGHRGLRRQTWIKTRIAGIITAKTARKLKINKKSVFVDEIHAKTNSFS